MEVEKTHFAMHHAKKTEFELGIEIVINQYRLIDSIADNTFACSAVRLWGPGTMAQGPTLRSALSECTPSLTLNKYYIRSKRGALQQTIICYSSVPLFHCWSASSHC